MVVWTHRTFHPVSVVLGGKRLDPHLVEGLVWTSGIEPITFELGINLLATFCGSKRVYFRIALNFLKD